MWSASRFCRYCGFLNRVSPTSREPWVLSITSAKDKASRCRLGVSSACPGVILLSLCNMVLPTIFLFLLLANCCVLFFSYSAKACAVVTFFTFLWLLLQHFLFGSFRLSSLAIDFSFGAILRQKINLPASVFIFRPLCFWLNPEDFSKCSWVSLEPVSQCLHPMSSRNAYDLFAFFVIWWWFCHQFAHVC